MKFNLPFLPNDIIINIILRLPFKSILACKRVSKQWKNLIKELFDYYRNNPKSMVVFIDNHMLYCALIRHDRRNKITAYPPYTVHKLPINLEKFDTYEGSLPHRLLPRSSDGIFCVKTADNRFIVYNLFTGAYYNVSNAYIQVYCFLTAYGFGYDRYADDYKIFMVSDCCRYREENSFWIYSFRNRSWKKFVRNEDDIDSDIAFSDITSPEACSINGVLHWKGTHAIVTYDLNTRRFGKISVSNGLRHWTTVSELDGRLCLVYENESKVWVMEVYDGVGESWTKLLWFDHCDIPLKWLEYTSMNDCEDGKKTVLFVCNHIKRWFWYDINKIGDN